MAKRDAADAVEACTSSAPKRQALGSLCIEQHESADGEKAVTAAIESLQRAQSLSRLVLQVTGSGPANFTRLMSSLTDAIKRNSNTLSVFVVDAGEISKQAACVMINCLRVWLQSLADVPSDGRPQLQLTVHMPKAMQAAGCVLNAGFPCIVVAVHDTKPDASGFVSFVRALYANRNAVNSCHVALTFARVANDKSTRIVLKSQECDELVAAVPPLSAPWELFTLVDHNRIVTSNKNVRRFVQQRRDCDCRGEAIQQNEAAQLLDDMVGTEDVDEEEA